VNILVVDAEGSPVLDRDVEISITVDGTGHLAGLGTGRPDPTDRFDASSCTTFDGHALAIVRPMSAGEIVVTASAEGLGAGTATVFVV